MSVRGTQICLDQYQLLCCRGVHAGTWTARDLQLLFLQRGTVLQVTPGGNIPGSCATGCQGVDPHNRTSAVHIPGSSVSILPNPSSHRTHIMLCVFIGLAFPLILLHLKYFWFPGLPGRTELANESSCESVKSQKGSCLG